MGRAETCCAFAARNASNVPAHHAKHAAAALCVPPRDQVDKAASVRRRLVELITASVQARPSPAVVSAAAPCLSGLLADEQLSVAKEAAQAARMLVQAGLIMLATAPQVCVRLMLRCWMQAPANHARGPVLTNHTQIRRARRRAHWRPGAQHRSCRRRSRTTRAAAQYRWRYAWQASRSQSRLC